MISLVEKLHNALDQGNIAITCFLDLKKAFDTEIDTEIDINSPSLNDTVLQRVKYTKFLGVIIDDGLNWTNHIAYVKNKIANGFGIILRARKFFNRKTLLNLYHAFIFL